MRAKWAVLVPLVFFNVPCVGCRDPVSWIYGDAIMYLSDGICWQWELCYVSIAFRNCYTGLPHGAIRSGFCCAGVCIECCLNSEGERRFSL